MNVGMTAGPLASAAGAPLSQTSGADAERTQKDSAVRERAADAQSKSEKTGGVGTTEQEHETGDRDADGRRLWEAGGKKRAGAKAEGDESEPERRAKDPTGVSGTALDLTG